MLTKRTLVLLLAISILNIFAFSQNIKDENSKQLEQKALGLLRETIREVPLLKSPDNRIYYSMQIAAYLSKYDEKQSRQLCESSMADARVMFQEIQADMQKPGAIITREVTFYEASNTAANSPYGQGPKTKTVEKLNPALSSKVARASQAADKIIRAAIFIDPMLAYSFYKDSLADLKEPQKYSENNYPGYRGLSHWKPYPLIIEQFKKRNDKKGLLRVADDIIVSDESPEVFDILKSVHASYPAEADKLAASILNYIIEDPKKWPLNYLMQFFAVAESINKSNPANPLLDEASMKRLAQKLGNTLLSEKSVNYPSPAQYANSIAKYDPQLAAAIRKKFSIKRSGSSGELAYYSYDGTNTLAVNTVANAANAAANRAARVAMEAANAAVRAAAEAANTAVNTTSNRRTGKYRRPKTVTVIARPQKSYWEIRQEKREEILGKLRLGKFTNEERSALLADCRRYAIADSGRRFDEGSISIVGDLVEFSHASTDKQLADELLAEASTYLGPQITNFSDYLCRLFLATGYSERDPDKSFKLMESMASINDVIASGIKIGAFMDVNNLWVSSGELNFGMTPFSEIIYGVNSGSRGIGFSDFVLNLAKSDFDRTKALADKFERPEIKMAARMLLIDAVLTPKSERGNLGRQGAGIIF